MLILTKRIITIAFSFLCVGCVNATSTEFARVEDFFKKAEFIGLVEVNKVNKLAEHCSVIIEATVTDSIKGDLKKIKFNLKNTQDLIKGHKKYFIIAYKNSTPASLNCNEIKLEYRIGDLTQTFFPINNNCDIMTSCNILVNRRSPFIMGSHIVHSDFIESFMLEGDRIYANIRLDIIIKQYLKTNNK